MKPGIFRAFLFSWEPRVQLPSPIGEGLGVRFKCIIIKIMETMVLERYILNAEEAFDRNEFLEGLEILEEALTIDPTFGKAHNHIGWLYLHKIIDKEKAEKHLELALKYAPLYAAPYIHMSHLLFEKGRHKELTALLNKANALGVVDKSFIHNEYGRLFEVRREFRKAVKNYKTAISFTFSDQDLNMYRDNIRRCRDKRWILMF